MSIAVQCTQHIPEYLQEKPEPPSAKAHGPAAQYGVNGLLGNVGMFSDRLAMDMSKLCVGGARQIKENQDFEQNVAPLRSLDSLNLQEVSGNLSQADHLSGGRTALAARVGVFAVVLGFLSCSSRPLPSVCPQMPLMDFPSQLDVLLMSDVALQSNVCEFCQAVFPGDTTTRGEFLRHLCTHIT